MKPLFIGVLPNFEKDDFVLAKKLLSSNEDYKDKKDEFASELLKLFFPHVADNELVKTAVNGSVEYQDKSQIYLLDSARSSFFFALRNLNLEKGSEILLPSFTCVVLVNPVLWAGLKPVFVDIDPATLNTKTDELVTNVTDKTKVILVQHTFGLPVSVRELREKLRKIGRGDIIIIEDLAHNLGGVYPDQKYQQQQEKEVQVGSIIFKHHQPEQKKEVSEINQQEYRVLGTQSDIVIITFGVEKAISTIRGGALLVNKNERTNELINNLNKDYKDLPELPKKYIRKLLLNPRFWKITTPLYNKGFGKFTLGKLFVYLGHRMNLLGIEIDDVEYGGGKPDYLPAQFPAKMAILGLNQLQKLPRFNDTRRENAKFYSELILKTELKDNPEQKEIAKILSGNLPHNFLRYPLLLPDKAKRNELLLVLRKQGIVAGDWYKTMFYTDEKFLRTLKYTKGDCPITEDIKDRIINLPTSPNVTKQHLETIKVILTEYYKID